MKTNLQKLRKEFNKIKEQGLIKSLRPGTTGVGYTFETLLNKKEDSESKPDYFGIELKTKLGYSKSPLNLFNCIPLRNGRSAINYIFNTYSIFKLNNKNIKFFEREIYNTSIYKNYKITFRIKINYYTQQIILKSYMNNEFIEDVAYWDFVTVEKKLKTKMNYLAIIEAYPYKYKNILYYKYLKMTTYKLKGFLEFLKLIEDDKIFVEFYLIKHLNNKIENHGVTFRIKSKNIEKLYTKLPF